MDDTKDPKAAKKAAAKGGAYDGFTDDERAAMKEHAQELKATRTGKRRTKADTEAAVLEKIAEMPDEDRVIAERLHTLIKENAPELTPKLWYGMPAYAKNGKVLCFVQAAAKFSSRYLTLGFDDSARLDDGTLWPTAFAVTELTAAHEKTIAALVRKAAG
ncbi:iron chaperone [Streptomyces sp. NPDC088789]|uniref:iron chaperone n=1 Tax=Streptomyces sp. NPDC088789 TaxID=3365899 RepID=UPI0037F3D555